MLDFLKALLKRYGSDNISDKAAALSYYTIFALGPLLFVIFGIIGLVIQSDNYKEQLSTQLSDLIGPQAGNLVNGVLSNQQLPHKTGAAFLIGIVGLILGAIGIFGQLQKSLNDIFMVKIGPGAGVKAIVRQKIISLGLVGVIAFLLIVSLLASAFSDALTHDTASSGFMLHGLDLVVSVVLLTVLLALLYRTLPAIKLPWSLVFKASFAVAIMFSIGKVLLGLIIGRNSSITAFGAAGSLIALVLWIFYSGQIVYLGASAMGLVTDVYNLNPEPKFRGKKGVMRLKKREVPYDNSLSEQVKHKFAEGFKRGWHNNKD